MIGLILRIGPLGRSFRSSGRNLSRGERGAGAAGGRASDGLLNATLLAGVFLLLGALMRDISKASWRLSCIKLS